jgi:prefoldin subunit 5
MNAEANEPGTAIAETIEYINERSQNLVRYSDKLSQAIRAIDKYIEVVGPQAGIKFTDSEIFYEEKNIYIFGDVKYRLSVRKDWGLYVVSNIDEAPNHLLTESSRAIKKNAIIRLPEFLKLYAAELEKYEMEYRDISEKAEKMAEILSNKEMA